MSKFDESGYVATLDDIQEITRNSLDAGAMTVSTHSTYLRLLVGTTQAELGVVQGRRKGVPAPLTPDESKKQLEALEVVHSRFYKVVLSTVTAAPLIESDRGRDRALVYGRRANFARSSKSVLRAWLLSENNIRSLVASKVTKYALQAEVTKRRSPPVRGPSEKRLLVVADRLLERIRSAGTPEKSISLLEVVISRLVGGLTEMGVETTANLAEAIRDKKMVETKVGVFWPSPVAMAA